MGSSARHRRVDGRIPIKSRHPVELFALLRVVAVRHKRLRACDQGFKIRDCRARSSPSGRALAQAVGLEHGKRDRDISGEKTQAFRAASFLGMLVRAIVHARLYAQFGESKLQCLVMIGEHLKLDASARASPAFEYATDQTRREIRKETHRIQGDMTQPNQLFEMHLATKEPSFGKRRLDHVRDRRDTSGVLDAGLEGGMTNRAFGVGITAIDQAPDRCGDQPSRPQRIAGMTSRAIHPV